MPEMGMQVKFIFLIVNHSIIPSLCNNSPKCVWGEHKQFLSWCSGLSVNICVDTTEKLASHYKSQHQTHEVSLLSSRVMAATTVASANVAAVIPVQATSGLFRTLICLRYVCVHNAVSPTAWRA